MNKPQGRLEPQRSTASLVESGQRTTSRNYAPQPVVLTHGEGAWVWDSEGNRYLDFLAGIAVNGLGYAHPALVAALQDQVGRLLHVSNVFYNEPQVLLQERIVASSFADRVFLCNSGAEANEAAIKLARRYQKVVAQAPQRVEIVAAEHSFHGRTLGAIAATGQPKYWKGFEPLPSGFRHVPFNDVDALRAAVGDGTCAVLLEPVQGEGGVRPASQAYLQAARELCDAHGALLIFDEVQCGVGRIGTLWAYESFGVTPDIATWAKGIGGGVPLGVMASTERVAAGFEKGSHASTFGGNPLASRAALVVLDELTRPGFLEHVRAMGERLAAGLVRLSERFGAGDVRGRGLLLGIQVGTERAAALMAAARRHGLLVNTAADVLRLVPPLIVGVAEVDEALSRLERAFHEVFTAQASDPVGA